MNPRQMHGARAGVAVARRNGNEIVGCESPIKRL